MHEGATAITEPDAVEDMTRIQFQGKDLHAPKIQFDGCQRSISPECTLERIRPYLIRAGITRLANLTGLDHVGIPVTLAVRPNGRTLSNSTGKGVTLPAALVSGAMEALEMYHAEEWSPPTTRRSYGEMIHKHVVPDWDDLPLARAAPFPKDWPYTWTWGWDLVSQQEIALPLSMIHLGNRTTTRVFDLFSFQTTSNGLASGNNLVEAIHSGLLEVIERDAVTCHEERWNATRIPPPIVDVTTIESQEVRRLLATLEDAEIDTILFDCSVDTNVPVYMALLLDRTGRVTGQFRGQGAHLDPEIALTRALTEAAQARVVYIAGSRDDLFRHREVHIRAARQQLSVQDFGAAHSVAQTQVSQATATFEGDVSVLLDHLKSVGTSQVVVVDLSQPYFPARVVKVVVPGLEGFRLESYSPGRRATAFAAG